MFVSFFLKFDLLADTPIDKQTNRQRDGRWGERAERLLGSGNMRVDVLIFCMNTYVYTGACAKMHIRKCTSVYIALICTRLNLFVFCLIWRKENEEIKKRRMKEGEKEREARGKNVG